MPLPEDTMNKIQEAVNEEMSTLRENIDSWSAKELLSWYKRAYAKATYKHLGRAMVALSKELGL